LKGSGIPHTFLRNDLAVGIAAVLAESGHENKTYELTVPLPWTFNDLVIALSELSGKPFILRQDLQIQNWIYGFLGKIDTRSTSADVEGLIGGPVTPYFFCEEKQNMGSNIIRPRLYFIFLITY